MSIEAPTGWECCEIGEVTKIVSGGTPPSKDLTNFTDEGGVPWITPADLSRYKDIYISRGRRNLSEKGFDACSAAKIPARSVLFSSRAPVGYVAISSNEVTTNQGFKSFILPDELDSRFVYFYLKHIKPIAEMMATGTTFKELSGSAAAKLPLVLAPLNEQKRIADKLDRLLAKVDACRERCDRIPLILKRFRQSVLAAATSGELTEDWQDGSLCSWTVQNVQDVSETVFDGPFGSNLKTVDYTHSGVRVIRLENIANLRFIGEKKTYISDEKYLSLQKHTLKPNDILFSSFVDEEVRVCLFPLGEEVSINKADCLCARVKPDVCLAKFLSFRLACNSTYTVLKDLVHGATRPRINLSQLRQFEFDLPPLAEQQEIVRRVEKLFAGTVN